MTSVQAAFADGPFGSSQPAARESAPVEKEPVEKEQTEQRDVAPSATADMKEPEANARDRDDRDDEGDDDLDTGEPNVENLRKALKSERSLNRQQRKEIKAALSRLEQIERNSQQVSQQVATIGRQQTPPAAQQQQAPEKPADDNDGFYINGPAKFVSEMLDKRLGTQDSIARQQYEHTQRSLLRMGEAQFVQRVQDGREHIDYFTGLVRQNPQLKAEFDAIVDGRHPQFTDPFDYAYQYAKAHKHATEASDPIAYRAKIRAEVEAELRGESPGGGAPRNAGSTQQRAPLTLAGHRGSGASAAPALAKHTPVEKTFAF